MILGCYFRHNFVQVFGFRVIQRQPVLALDFFIVFAGWIVDILVPIVTGTFMTKFDADKWNEVKMQISLHDVDHEDIFTTCTRTS